MKKIGFETEKYIKKIYFCIFIVITINFEQKINIDTSVKQRQDIVY